MNPKDVFADPRGFIRGELMHGAGSSFHIPTGGAVYFDNGVIEVATPLVEIERGCAVRAGRSLWESITFVRDGLDDWEARAGNSTRLLAFSTHYNVSFDVPDAERAAVHASRHEGLDERHLPAGRRRHQAHAEHRLLIRPPRQLGALLKGDEGR